MNKKNNTLGIPYILFPKISLKMKLTTLFLIIALFRIQASTYSQNTKITLELDAVSIMTVFEEIEKRSEFKFLGNREVLDNVQLFSVHVKKERIDKILNDLFRGTDITYRILDRQIILKKDKQKSLIYTPPVPKSIEIQAQQNIVNGTISDNSGTPLPGANILEKGTTNGTQADFDGNFSIEVSDENSTLVISYVGFSTKEIVLNGQSTINIIMEESAAALDEIVVVGYGSVKKSDLTGSVSSVKVDDFQKGTNTSVDGLLNGVSGVNIIQNNGEPGGSFSINVRGASSISAGNSPLYVIDGFPVDNSPALGSGGDPGFSGSRSPRNPLASINPQDIESIEILKDASATAIYGSRGANGVILITTKSGQTGKVKVSFQSSTSFQTVFNRLDLLSAQDYKRILNDIIAEGGGSQEEIVGDISNGGKGTNWQELVTNDLSLMQNHQVSFTGGTDATKYFMSLNYVDQEGVVKSTDFNRYGLRFNLDSKVSDKFNVGLNLSASYTENTFVPNGFSTNENAGALYSAVNFDPTLPVKDENGVFVISPILSIDNPMALIDGTSSNSRNNRILASVTGEYAFTDALTAKLNLGGDMVNENRKNYISRLTKNGSNSGGIAGNYQGENGSYLAEFTLNYNKTFGEDHVLDLLGGTSYQRFSSANSAQRGDGFPSDATGANNMGLANSQTLVSNNSVSGNRLASLIGRANYGYKNKYSTTLTVRRDGSSRFGANNRFGTFPSAAVAWKVSEEDFLKDSELFNFLKFRGSWGQTGNQEIGNFAYQSTFGGSSSPIWDGMPVTATQPLRQPNPDLKWEQTEQINVGLDFGLWNNRISGSLDYYTKTTSDMLFDFPIPVSTGFNSVLRNIGEIKNSGFDISINSKNITTRDFQWTTNVTLTTMKNKVVDLGGIPEIYSGGDFLHVSQIGIIKPGNPLNSFFGWEIEGVWQQGDDFSTTKENVEPGSLKYVDQNGDGFVNGDDRVILGNSFPDFQWSMGNTFSYKNLELFVFFEGIEGIEMLNGNLIESYFPINFRRNKFAEDYLNRWTPDNPTNEYPSFVDPLSQGRKTVNSKTVQDASYFKLKNIKLTYNIPDNIKWFPSGQFFVSVDNLFVISDYDGIDPALNPNNNATLRVDFNSYPSARTYTFGFRIDL
ncbi:TonB-dependent receptor [Arenibacter sp. S6351L]|uniref:TonB-dependent receptor n=1 Tax=Arenibacter sp. S6351L TaxID=2926407 RepID=UPI001FF386E8|nr:TonB-dependent receptor [Arenibacter sp. S6351L]MCK0137018.1 TonB-dependent receptor [Arenibacter sp. S6351L]